MRKLLILCGLSGSGKSTYRNAYIKEHPGTIVLCRDSLREALTGLSAAEYNQHPVKEIESTITRIIESVYNKWTIYGEKDLIIDQTNLRLRYINDFLKDHVDQEIILIDTPVEVCKTRVAERDGYINTDYIDKQHQQLTELKKHIVFDKIVTSYVLKIPTEPSK